MNMLDMIHAVKAKVGAEAAMQISAVADLTIVAGFKPNSLVVTVAVTDGKDSETYNVGAGNYAAAIALMLHGDTLPTPYALWALDAVYASAEKAMPALKSLRWIP